MRYARSAVTDEALVASATDVRSLLGGSITTGRVFWAKGIWVYNSGVAGLLELWDVAEGATPAATTERFAIPLAAASLTYFEFPGKGLEFRTNICASISAGTVAAYQAGCTGYEEGAGG